MKDFFRKLKKSLISYLSLVVALIAVLKIKLECTISVKWIVIAGVISVALTNSAIMTISDLKKSQKDSEEFFVKSFEISNNNPIFYIEYSKFLPEDAIVSIYYKKSSTKHICAGRINDVYPGSYTSVEVIQETVVKGREQLLDEICTASPDVLNNVFIKVLVKYDSVIKIAQKVARDTNE